MAIYPLVGFKVQTASIIGSGATLGFAVQAAAVAGGTSLGFQVQATDPFGDASRAPSRFIGAKVTMDRGDGTMERVKAKDLGDTITLRGTLDGYGTRELTISKYGSEQSPLKSHLLRSPRKVRLDVTRGVPGKARGDRRMFDGYLRSPSYQPYPPAASLTFQDESLKYANVPIVYTLAPGAGLTRLQIILSVIAQYSIPLGRIALPGVPVFTGRVTQSGREMSGDGGTFKKGISEHGDNSVLQWLQAFSEPMGCRISFRDGLLNIQRFVLAITPRRTLKCNNYSRVSIQPPNTDAPNAIRFSALLFAYLGSTGQRTEVKTSSSNAVYAPQVATNKQNHSTGAITATGLTSTAVSREVSRVITTTNYDGGTVLTQIIEEWGWYAPKACNKQQAVTTGTVTYNASFDVYQFADGSWRTTAQEDFQVIRRTVLARTFDTDGYLTAESTLINSFDKLETFIATVPVATEVPAACFVTDDLRAWTTGKEEFNFGERIDRTFRFDSVHRLLSVQDGIFGAVAEYLPASSSPLSAGTVVFGPANAKRYAIAPFGVFAVATITRSYAPLTESTYRDTTSVTDNKLIPGTPAAQSLPPAGAVVVTGTIPVDEQKTSQQLAQSASVTLNDQVRQNFTDGKVVTVYQQNDYCETEGELQTCALEIMREIASPRVQIDKDWADYFEMEGDTIAIDHPSVSNGPAKLLVWDASWTQSLASGKSSESLSCLYYPPELQ